MHVPPFRMFNERDWEEFPFARGIALVAHVALNRQQTDLHFVVDGSGMYVRVCGATKVLLHLADDPRRDLSDRLTLAINRRSVDQIAQSLIEMGFDPVLTDHD